MRLSNLLLFLRPDLVSPAYKDAEPLPARDQKHRVEIAKASNWPGYWGSPGFATRSRRGGPQWKPSSSRWVELALKILDGFDYRQMKRFGDGTLRPRLVAEKPSHSTIRKSKKAAGMAEAKRARIGGSK